MKKWQDYKQTYRTESDLFDFARAGDLRGFATLISQQPALDLNEINQKGFSALMLAVYNGQQDFCEALLRSGADVNSTDSIGNTVLMASAYKGNLNIVKLLLDFGARTNDLNNTKMNARDWALMFGRKEIVQFFDTNYPDNTKSSKLKGCFRFLQLSFVMVLKRIKK
jgi:ankyrin repeat protein